MNRTDGCPPPEHTTPRRPTIPDARYRAVPKVAGKVGWRFRVALILAHETGHRAKSVRHLRWADVNLDARRVRWRGEEDKSGHEHTTAQMDAAVEALREAKSVVRVWARHGPSAIRHGRTDGSGCGTDDSTQTRSPT